MFLLYVLILWQIQGAAQYRFNMYNTDHGRDGYCLLYYVDSDDLNLFPLRPGHQIIPYCLRSSEESISIAPLNNSTIIHSTISFAKLREKNISSELLISWSAPIDQAESYQIFLYNASNSSSEANSLFYNCTFPWFGPFCRFAFDPPLDRPLYSIVDLNFLSKGIRPDDFKVTCYKHIQCNTSLICLDWREICDGKMDCLDGSDEFNCWQLEMNECTKNEYRCYNGQCIPEKFYRDNDTDCLDQTDEINKENRDNYHCLFDAAFQCEEHTTHPGKMEFPCGDGTYQHEMGICSNGRSIVLNNNSCSNATICLLWIGLRHRKWCDEFCNKATCVVDHCPPLYEFPSGPILFGHIRFIFSREEVDLDYRVPTLKYVCYNEEFCGVDFLPATVHWNNLTCRSLDELGVEIRTDFLETMVNDVKNRFRGCSMISNEIHYLNQTMMYQCRNSKKYISKYRLLDRTKDCPFGDDEIYNNESCSLNDAKYRFHCSIDDRRLCFAPFIRSFDASWKYEEDCTMFDEAHPGIQRKTNQISFQMICDGYEDLLPMLIKGQNETDETGCEYWFCNNTYTRCDGFWSCKDGVDEVNCPPSTCPAFSHSCVFLNDTSHVSCLPMNQAGDGIIDCLGATDERKHCQFVDPIYFSYSFSCSDGTECLSDDSICDGKIDCQLGDDELFCINTHWSSLLCLIPESLTQVEQFICNFTKKKRNRPKFLYFKLHNIPIYSSKLNLSNDSFPLTSEKKMVTNEKNLKSSNTNADDWRCNRGLRIRIRTSKNGYDLSCLCPPSYYGDRCQYQNQRVSLTIQIRTTSEWTIMFTFLIFLIDDETNIESHDHIEYLSIRDCSIKFNIYLLYSTRPKNSSKSYSIRIDAFNRLEMKHRASWIFPLRFSFLPVERLPVQLIVPLVNFEPLSHCLFPCIHGQCFSFVNDNNSSFCRCFPGWSGRQCNKTYLCNCEHDSECIDDSVCLCPIGRFGPRCSLFQSLCHSNSCINNGQCVRDDERYTYVRKNKSICVCPSEYVGDRCESPRRQTQIDISFDDSLTIPPSLVVHLLQVQYKSEPNHTSMIKKIGFDQSSLTFYTSAIFNLAFGEMLKKYYLIILREENITLSHISTKIIPSHQCRSINELFNETVVQDELLRRIKLYHIPCKEQRELVCFYDSIHFCLCDRDRRANCFQFNHNVNHDCDGFNSCENGGQCVLDNLECPTLTTCACSQCSFGSRCQFSTEGSTLLLDIILGYRINPKTGITGQSSIIKGAIGITIIIFVLSLISNLCTFLTFQMKGTRDVGCGTYLFASSVIGLIIVCILLIKFWLLLTSQIGLIKTHSFLQVQCISIDFLLRVLLVSGDWFRACTSIERSINISQGINFNKSKSKKIAKWVIILVLIFVSCTHLHDPIHRRLIDDNEEQRTWCITKYSSSLKIFDLIVNIIHFSVPFLINLISAIFIIITAARGRLKAHKKLSYKHHLREQFQEHKHLLISSVVLVVLAIPRLYISLLSGCMKSTRDSWLYLIGYYISFIPSMLNFIVFVLPSKLYKAEFKKSIKRFL
jgi:hypothetical protein